MAYQTVHCNSLPGTFGKDNLDAFKLLNRSYSSDSDINIICPSCKELVSTHFRSLSRFNDISGSSNYVPSPTSSEPIASPRCSDLHSGRSTITQKSSVLPDPLRTPSLPTSSTVNDHSWKWASKCYLSCIQLSQLASHPTPDREARRLAEDSLRSASAELEAMVYINDEKVILALKKTLKVLDQHNHDDTLRGTIKRLLQENRSLRPSNLQSSERRKVLPVHLELSTVGEVSKKYFDAVPDTGSDENAMDWETFRTLGLALNRDQLARKQFSTANGKSFRSIGEAEVTCYFALDSSNVQHKVRFNVFSRLAAPVIFGRGFLDQTETLTRHTHRLKRKETPNVGLPKIMHFNRSGRRMQCSVDGIHTFANADTGAEMNLVSPSFVAKMSRGVLQVSKEDLRVQFADGTIERITKSVIATLSLNGDQGSTNLKTMFYVLPGLTSDVLIGEDTLYEADVFSKHLNTFIDIFNDDDHLSLNIIKWLTQKESRLLDGCKKRFSRPPKRGTWSPTTLLDINLNVSSFHNVLAEADARELHCREQSERRIAHFPIRERAAALDAEQARAATYDSERARCLALHQQRLTTQQK